MLKTPCTLFEICSKCDPLLHLKQASECIVLIGLQDEHFTFATKFANSQMAMLYLCCVMWTTFVLGSDVLYCKGSTC